MKTLIPLPNGRHVTGESRSGDWTTGDYFRFDGNRYQFLGCDAVGGGGLHARRVADQRLVVFESAWEWESTIDHERRTLGAMGAGDF